MAAKRPVITLLLSALVGVPLLMLPTCHNGGAMSGPAETEKVTIDGVVFSLEVAADRPAIERGLMFRKTIPDGTGMLFIFPDAQVRSFWMKNCLTDIDIIFLDPQGHVTATHRMKAEPPKRDDETDAQYEARIPGYSSQWPAQFAIELPPGTLDQLNVRFEDKIDLDLDRLKALAH